MPDYLLLYDYAPDAAERRRPLRAAHLRMAWDSIQRGELVLGGAYAEPMDGAVLYFRCPSKAVIEEFVRADPYVREGVVTSWRIREWTTVAGHAAERPVRPEDV